VQEASSSSKPTVREDLGHLVSEVSGLRLAKKALSGAARQKMRKATAKTSKTRTGGIQQPRNVGAPNQGETSTDTLKRPRSEDCTPTEAARPPERPRDSSGPGTYKEVADQRKDSHLQGSLS
jgi:hypothetical protein